MSWELHFRHLALPISHFLVAGFGPTRASGPDCGCRSAVKGWLCPAYVQQNKHAEDGSKEAPDRNEPGGIGNIRRNRRHKGRNPEHQ